MCADILYEEGQYEDALRIVQNFQPASNQLIDESFGNQESESDGRDEKLISEKFANAVNQGCIYYQMQNLQKAL